MIHERLKELRKQMGMTQADVTERTGLLRVYLSRLENGRTTPSIPTLEKLARAFDIPIYRFFYESETPPKPPTAKFKDAQPSPGVEEDFETLRRTLPKLTPQERKFLLNMASGLSRRGSKESRS